MPSRSKSMRPEPEKVNPEVSRSSRINRQKRDIANRVEYMRLNAKNKCLVFVLTCPVESDFKTQNENISKFFQNLSKSHVWGRCNNYVWVREYQKNGRPHWHCISDIPRFPIKDVNRYWSGLWKNDSRNSIRLHRGASRFLAKNSNRLCWYLCKYFTKNFAPDGKSFESNARKFGSSQELSANSKPSVSLAIDRAKEIEEKYDVIPVGHETYMCLPKSWNVLKKRSEKEAKQKKVEQEKAASDREKTEIDQTLIRELSEDLLVSNYLL